MTKQEFLDRMDRVKGRAFKGNRSNYTCHAIQELNISSKMLENYQKVFDAGECNFAYIPAAFGQTKSRDIYLTRIAALELFEIISIEEGLYVNY